MGFWESTALVAEHNRFLRKARSSWSDARVLDVSRLRPGELAETKTKTGEIIQSAWGEASLLVIKDPRICRFAPFFVETLNGLEIETKVVLALRSPQSVIASLQAREGMGADYGRLLWLRHMIAAEQASRGLPRIAVDYDNLIEDWRSAIPALSDIIGVAWSPDDSQQKSIDAFLKPQLRHHTTIADATRGPLHNTVDRVWRGLSALTAEDDFEARRELSRAYDRFEEKPWLDGDTVHSEMRRLLAKARAGWKSDDRAGDGSLGVHAIVPLSPAGPQSSAYIRLVQPLTDPEAESRVRLSVDGWTGSLPDCDVCIVQRAALPDENAAGALLATLERRDVPLVVDLDDDFNAMSSGQVEAGGYSDRLAALDLLLAASREVWFSSHTLAATRPSVDDRALVLPNTIDPRLWRDWRRHSTPDAHTRTSFLYMGTGTHAEDFAVIRPHLEGLWLEREGQFDVTVIGVATEIEPAPWLTHIQPPPESRAYPKFVAWLREQGPFDIGLAPLANTAFNNAKSDIKLLDYSALGLGSLVSDCPAYQADPVFRSALVGDWPKSLREALDQPQVRRNQAAVAAAHTWLNRTVSFTAVKMLERLEALTSRTQTSSARLSLSGG
ncbi:hypothetical protein ASG17_12790 [Brevundimonas sp. Leaf363]|uniref:hypothetical protein n=1 Tax=Brevundimonas sp. Leaf363 TaxID=1736353 RepID=UPI0006F9D0DC|nr:hypothetical protein [Brevundimonas sp. Leaf363]KQS53837.1 hypothetical protein ASG17_12790 [Brevundimonas sp. Leaf363]